MTNFSDMTSQPSNITNDSSDRHNNISIKSAVTGDVWLNFAPYWHIQCGRTHTNNQSRFRNRKCGNIRMSTTYFLRSIIDKQHERIQEIKQIAKKFLQGYQNSSEQNIYTNELMENNADKLNCYLPKQRESICNQFNETMKELVIEIIDLNGTNTEANSKYDQDSNSNTYALGTCSSGLISSSKRKVNNDDDNYNIDRLHDCVKALIKQNERIFEENKHIVCFPK